jgi:hypothetical protein
MIKMPRRFGVLGMQPDFPPSCPATRAAVGMLCLELFLDRGGKFWSPSGVLFAAPSLTYHAAVMAVPTGFDTAGCAELP